MSYIKSQVAIEYVIFTGLIIIIMLASTFILYRDYSNQIYKKEVKSLNDLGRSLQTELFIAADMTEGYFRTIYIPERTHDFFRFNISSYKLEFVLNGSRVGDMGFTTPLYIGEFKTGENNTITKLQNGTISITQ